MLCSNVSVLRVFVRYQYFSAMCFLLFIVLDGSIIIFLGVSGESLVLHLGQRPLILYLLITSIGLIASSVS